MKTQIFLVVDRYKVLRICKRNPGLRQNERCVKLSIAIPDSVFVTPVMAAAIEVSPAEVARPISVTAEPIAESSTSQEASRG